MINFFLEHISGRYINDKGRRMLLLTSLYVLIMRIHNQEPEFEKFNQELRLVHDINAINLASVIYPIIWNDRFKAFVKDAEIERVIRYVQIRIPKWLDYSKSGDYSLPSDLAILKKILP